MSREEMNPELQRCRNRIREIDNELLILLNSRTKIALEIASIKHETGECFRNREVEREKINYLQHQYADETSLTRQSIENIMQTIFDETLAIEKKHYPDTTK
ncbi:MAG: hypothetical protein ETSY2_26710 [Candidatus Entotheonella gemina]|uniref:chorismate mutase n=1 Tax=Candidatus Entotheonella gemina TaxID=1429439 RepID=W4M3Q4_9BACT|nr:MAG: hypothetical protein ETSY2_26710 [Candidatus Entotheonella gemina]